MSEKLSKNHGESQTEKKPGIKFEHDWPIEELAHFVSDVRTEEDNHEFRRQILTPEQVREKLENYLKNPNAIELVLTIGDELIGCAFSFEEFREDLEKQIPGINLFSDGIERIFCIREVDVKKKYRGRGFGRMIIEEIMQEVEQKGATKIILSTFPYEDNPAFRLYKKIGFKGVAPMAEQIKKSFYYMSYDCAKK